jgi:hypothetical protein
VEVREWLAQAEAETGGGGGGSGDSDGRGGDGRGGDGRGRALPPPFFALPARRLFDLQRRARAAGEHAAEGRGDPDIARALQSVQ